MTSIVLAICPRCGYSGSVDGVHKLGHPKTDADDSTWSELPDVANFWALGTCDETLIGCSQCGQQFNATTGEPHQCDANCE